MWFANELEWLITNLKKKKKGPEKRPRKGKVSIFLQLTPESTTVVILVYLGLSKLGRRTRNGS